MPKFEWRHFVDVAEELAKGEHSPAQIRTALGRAYYGVYGTLRENIVSTFGDCFKRRGWHSQLFSACTAAPEKPLRKLGKLLQVLCEFRMDADYDLSKVLTPTEATGAIDSARDALERIRNLSKSELLRIYDALKLAIDILDERPKV